MKLIILLSSLLLFAIISLTTPLTIPSIYAWSFGDFSAGDTFVYDICDYTTLDPYTAILSKCYELSMVVLGEVKVDTGLVWLVHVIFDGKNDIIFIDESLKIKSTYHKYIATSLSNTIFWMNHNAKIQFFEPVVGDVITSIPSKYFDVDIIVSDFAEYTHYTKYLLSWFTTNESQIWIRDDVPLPVDAVVFSEMYAGNDTPYAFTFNLLNFDRANLHDVLPFEVTMYDMTNTVQSDVMINDISPDVIINYTNITDTTYNDTTYNYTKHFDDITENITDDITYDILENILENTIIENSTILVPSKPNILISEDEPSIAESEIILNHIQVPSIKEDGITQYSKQKPEEGFLDILFSFFSSLIGIR